MTANIYLNFNGDCEAAFNFYKSVFGGEFLSFNRFSEMPPMEGKPAMPEEMGNRVMHVTLPIGGDTVIMGSDVGGEWAPMFNQGNNFSISLNTTDQGETEKVFKALSENGTVTYPLEKTFWGAYFGMLKDQFGINWMVNCELNA